MTGMRPFATACTLAVLLGIATFAYASIVGTPEFPQAAKQKKGLQITGNVDGLDPGVPATLSAKVKNNLSRKVKVRSLKVAVGDASAACPRTLLTVQGLKTTKKALKPRKTHTIPVTMLLSAAVPDACQDATFPLKFSARATAAR